MAQKRQFSFSSWIDKYSQFTFKSKVIELDEEFLSYLRQDSIQLPNEQYFPQEYDTLSSTDSDSTEDVEEEVPEVKFPEIEKKVVEAIRMLGGKVIPKLNWSSPKDACWISFSNSLECKTFSEILMLLKASDFISHDLLNGATELVLRKWHNIDPSMEFRLFIKDGQIVGISQRDIYNYYTFLVENADSIWERITSFYSSLPAFHENNYVIDVYLDQSYSYIIDFNFWGEETDSLLFKWEEFVDSESLLDKNGDAELRIIESRSDPRMIREVAYSTNRVPFDMVALGHGLTCDEFFQNVCLENLK